MKLFLIKSAIQENANRSLMDSIGLSLSGSCVSLPPSKWDTLRRLKTFARWEAILVVQLVTVLCARLPALLKSKGGRSDSWMVSCLWENVYISILGKREMLSGGLFCISLRTLVLRGADWKRFVQWCRRNGSGYATNVDVVKSRMPMSCR